MKPAIWLALSLSIAAAPAWTVEKCKDASGKTYYSDRGCTGAGQKVKGDPSGGAHAIATSTGDQDIARKCMEQSVARSGSGTADTTRLESYQVRTVAVKDVGPRRLFDVTVGFRNPAGYWAESLRYSCLLRGDNVSFQTTPYEIVN